MDFSSASNFAEAPARSEPSGRASAGVVRSPESRFRPASFLRTRKHPNNVRSVCAGATRAAQAREQE